MSADVLPSSLVPAAGAILLATSLCVLYLEGLAAILGGRRPGDMCTRCRKGLIARVSASPLGVRFSLCHICGARYRRSSRAGPWQDASAPEHDRAFAKETPNGTCGKPTPPTDEESYRMRTIDTLLRSKRLRGPDRADRRGAGDREGLAHVSPLWDRELDQGACGPVERGKC